MSKLRAVLFVFPSMIRLACAALLSLGSLAVTERANAEDAKRAISMAVFSFPPSVDVVDGEIEGFLPDHMSAVAAKAGYEIAFTALPFRRYVHGVANGKHDLLWGAKDYREFAGTVNISPQPIELLSLNVYGLHDEPAVRRKEDFGSKRIALITGYNYSGLADYLRSNALVYDIPDHRAAIKFLIAGRADYLLDYGPAFQVNSKGIEGLSAVKKTVFNSTPMFLITSKTRDPDGQMLSDLWDAHTHIISAPGYRETALEKGYIIPEHREGT